MLNDVAFSKFIMSNKVDVKIIKRNTGGVSVCLPLPSNFFKDSTFPFKMSDALEMRIVGDEIIIKKT